MCGEVERRGRNISACFSLGFHLLQDLTEIYQDDKGEGEKNTITKVSVWVQENNSLFLLSVCGELLGMWSETNYAAEEHKEKASSFNSVYQSYKVMS